MRFLPILAILIALVTAISCGGDNGAPVSTPPTTQSYFSQLALAWAEHQIRLAALPPPAAPFDYKQAMEPVLASLQQFTRKVDSIQPAPEASDAHHRLVDALTEAVDLEKQGLEEYDPSVTADPDATQAPEAVANSEALDRACKDLATIAAQNSITSDFFCLESTGGMSIAATASVASGTANP